MTRTPDDPSNTRWINRIAGVLTPQFFTKLSIALGIGLIGGLIAHFINMRLPG